MLLTLSLLVFDTLLTICSKLKCPTSKCSAVRCAANLLTRVSSLCIRDIASGNSGSGGYYDFAKRTYRNIDSTLKRHGYYCRSQKGTTRNVRSRSCAPCAKAKARCDNRRPRCERCAAKDLDCRIPGRMPSRLAHSMRDLEETAHDFVNKPSERTAIETVVTFTPIDDDFAIIENTDIEFGIPEFSEGWDMIPVEPPSTSQPPFASTRQHVNNDTNILAVSALQTHFESSTPPTSIPSMPSFPLRSFTRRSSSTSTTTTLILRILASYPSMLTDPTSPPPFIHPSFLTGANDLESLSTCASLMHLLGARNQSLLWKNVRLECERLQVQVPSPSFSFSYT
jgi:hypothetical protein